MTSKQNSVKNYLVTRIKIFISQTSVWHRVCTSRTGLENMKEICQHCGFREYIFEGENVVYQFVELVTSQQNKFCEIICIAHNGRGLYKGPLPPSGFYSPDTMSVEARKVFFDWYATLKKDSEYVFNFQTEVLYYTYWWLPTSLPTDQSNIAIEWLSWQAKELGKEIGHAARSREYRTPEGILVDGYQADQGPNVEKSTATRI